MKISVVTACYNSAATIADTIESFLAQDYPDKEMLIVDGASRDATKEVVARYPSPLIRYYSEPDRGVYDAMNKGLRLFSGDAVGTLNSDDVYHDNTALSRIADGLQTADIVYGDLNMVRDHAAREVVRQWRAGEYSRFSYQLGWMAPHPTFYVRRAVAERVGLFDLSYRIAADYDFMIRAMTQGNVRIRYIPHTLVDFKMGGVSTRNWRATLALNLECLHARRVHLNAPPVDAAIFLRPLRRLFQIRSPFTYLRR